MVKSLRNKRHYSQEQLAQISGLSLRTIQRVESGQSASLETLKSLAAVFEIDVDTLKGDITVIDKKSEDWALAPAWVKLGFWGIRDRRVAIRFEILSLVCGFVGSIAALFYPTAAVGPFFFSRPTATQFRFGGWTTKGFGAELHFSRQARVLIVLAR